MLGAEPTPLAGDVDEPALRGFCEAVGRRVWGAMTFEADRGDLELFVTARGEWSIGKAGSKRAFLVVPVRDVASWEDARNMLLAALPSCGTCRLSRVHHLGVTLLPGGCERYRVRVPVRAAA